MLSRELPIVNKLGLHARAATRLVTLASGYRSEVRIARKGRVVNGKSIMGVMMLAAARGTTIEVSVEGEDEVETLEALTRLVADRFGEDE
jgi:phosphocarrier protein HPr